MSFILDGKKIGKLGVLTEPSTYDTNTSPVDVQKGAVYYAHGERRVGTGKAFEFAEYGSRLVKEIIDSEGKKRYGAILDVGENANVIFVAPSDTGDIVRQENYLVDISKNNIEKLGTNQTTGGELNAYYDNNCIIIYFTAFSQEETVLRFFVGKDNHI